jgi:hypothetical protein
VVVDPSSPQHCLRRREFRTVIKGGLVSLARTLVAVAYIKSVNKSLFICPTEYIFVMELGRHNGRLMLDVVYNDDDDRFEFL